jgi:aspartyl protease family protein
MGHVRIPIRLRNPTDDSLFTEVTDALVDTGATWTIIPRSIAAALQLREVGPFMVRTAAGPQQLVQSYAFVELPLDKSMVAPLLISETLDIVLIGVTTLEALGLAVDPTSETLKESEILLL